MQVKQNQIVAVEKGVKNRVQADLTTLYHSLQKEDLFNGFVRSYTPKDDDVTTVAGEVLPSESKKVQQNSQTVLSAGAKLLTELFNVTATKDYGNCQAKADVVVDGTVLLKDVPVTFLIFLEKQLNNYYTVAKTVPVLATDEDWLRDDNKDLYMSTPKDTSRTKKVSRPLVLAPATDKHPAQVKEVTEDVQVGTWRTVKLSGAMTAKEKNEFLERIQKLSGAVKFARERANETVVEHQFVGEAVFGYLLK